MSSFIPLSAHRTPQGGPSRATSCSSNSTTTATSSSVKRTATSAEAAPASWVTPTPRGPKSRKNSHATASSSFSLAPVPIHLECTSIAVLPAAISGSSPPALVLGMADGSIYALPANNNSNNQPPQLDYVGRITPKGVHRSLRIQVVCCHEYVFAGVLRGSLELLAIPLSHCLPPKSGNHTTTPPDILSHSDAKLRGFGAATYHPSTQSYTLLTGLGIKHLHVWSFDGRTFRKQHQIMTNGSSLHFLALHNQYAYSQSDHQKVRVWDLKQDPPSFHDLEHTQHARAIVFHPEQQQQTTPTVVCGGGGHAYTNAYRLCKDGAFNEVSLPVAADENRRRSLSTLQKVDGIVLQDHPYLALQLDDQSLWYIPDPMTPQFIAPDTGSFVLSYPSDQSIWIVYSTPGYIHRRCVKPGIVNNNNNNNITPQPPKKKQRPSLESRIIRTQQQLTPLNTPKKGVTAEQPQPPGIPLVASSQRKLAKLHAQFQKLTRRPIVTPQESHAHAQRRRAVAQLYRHLQDFLHALILYPHAVATATKDCKSYLQNWKEATLFLLQLQTMEYNNNYSNNNNINNDSCPESKNQLPTLETMEQFMADIEENYL